MTKICIVTRNQCAIIFNDKIRFCTYRFYGKFNKIQVLTSIIEYFTAYVVVLANQWLFNNSMYACMYAFPCLSLKIVTVAFINQNVKPSCV